MHTNIEIRDCSPIQDPLRARVNTQCSKIDVYVLTLRSCRIQTKVSNDFNFYVLLCYTLQ